MATMGPKKSRNTSGASGTNDMQAVASLAVLAKVHAEAKSDADAGLLNIIQEHEAAFLAWDATGTEDGLSEGSPEDRAAYAAETLLIFAPCRSYADVRAKIGYIYHRQTAAAQDAYDAVVGREDDFLGFLGSLIGIEAPEMQAAADEAGNDTLIDVIQAYRAGVKAYADHPEFSGHDEENEVAEATYGVHADKLDKWDAPATNREEAIEALRFALEDAAQWCGSVTTSTMIKAALGYLEGSPCVPAGCASTNQAVATVSPTIPEMYEEWLAIRDRDLTGMTDEEADVGYRQYASLQARIITAEAQTPRDVAIMFIVDSDYMESDHSEEFEQRMRQLAQKSCHASAEPSALVQLIAIYTEAKRVWETQWLEDEDKAGDSVEWNAYEDAGDAILNYPCATMDEIRIKAAFVLSDENLTDTLMNCYRTVNGAEEYCLLPFLRSMLSGEVARP